MSQSRKFIVAFTIHEDIGHTHIMSGAGDFHFNIPAGQDASDAKMWAEVACGYLVSQFRDKMAEVLSWVKVHTP